MTTTTMPNNILIGSEKLFRTKAPWRINGSLLGRVTPDHDVILFTHDSSKEQYDHAAKRIGQTLYRKTQRQYNKITFIGFGSDCRIAAELATLGFNIDAAVFIDNVHNTETYDVMYDHTAIYNFMTSQKCRELRIQGAECNQFVDTVLPANMSNRLAAEIAGCLLYQTHEMTYLNPVAPRFTLV